jgi:hypothetical protein
VVEAEKELLKNPVRVDPKEGFAESNETCNVQNRIRRELVKLHAIHKKQPTKEFVGKERKTAEEKSKKHHPMAARGLGDALGNRKNDRSISNNYSLLLGLN